MNVEQARQARTASEASHLPDVAAALSQAGNSRRHAAPSCIVSGELASHKLEGIANSNDKAFLGGALCSLSPAGLLGGVLRLRCSRRKLSTEENIRPGAWVAMRATARRRDPGTDPTHSAGKLTREIRPLPQSRRQPAARAK